MINIHNIDIGQGDCFVIKLNKDGKVFNLLVDLGKVNKVPEILGILNNEKLNGVVVTHIDQDHIVGVKNLFDPNYKDQLIENTFLLFNKYDDTLISYRQGNDLLKTIRNNYEEKFLFKSYSRHFMQENDLIESKRDPDKTLKSHLLSLEKRKMLDNKDLAEDEVYMTVLSPDNETVRAFMANWTANQTSAEITNRSSIIILIEFEGKKMLMLGDGYTEDVVNKLSFLEEDESIDFIKISHHGADANNSYLVNIVKKYKCKSLCVTVPERYNKHHPDKQLILDLRDRSCTVYTATNINSDGHEHLEYLTVQDKYEV